MNFLETLQARKGRLLRIKTELFWYGGRVWDKNPGRVCLILGAAAYARATAATTITVAAVGDEAVAAYLLIDGSTHWVWMAEQDVELL